MVHTEEEFYGSFVWYMCWNWEGRISHIGLPLCINQLEKEDFMVSVMTVAVRIISPDILKRHQLYPILVSFWNLASHLCTDQNILQAWAIYCRHSHSTKLQRCNSKLETIRRENQESVSIYAKDQHRNTTTKQRRHYDSWTWQKIFLSKRWRDLWNVKKIITTRLLRKCRNKLR